MTYTPAERRQKFLEYLETNEEYRQIMTEYTREQKRFYKFTDKLPKQLRAILCGYPGISYFLYHRTLTMLSRYVRLPEETE
jgi:hypothetical protein